MKAYLKQDFKKGFLLSEETIIKISDIILKRLKENNITEKLNYKVYRKDSLVYETTDYKKIVEEENSKRNLINILEIYHSSDALKFKLTFDKEEDSHLEIEASEKDFAYLLFSDIKEYLSTEILRFRGFKFENLKVERYFLPILMLFMIVFLFSSVDKTEFTDSQINHILSTDSSNVKLDYLVQNSRTNIDTKNFWYFLIGAIIFSVLLSFSTEILDAVYQRNIFYIGKEITRYDRFCNTRSKIIWGIMIAFIISLVAGFFVFYFTNGK